MVVGTSGAGKTAVIEAVLLFNGSKSALLKAIAQTLSLFPFALIPPNTGDFNDNSRLEILRHGLDEEMILLQGKK